MGVYGLFLTYTYGYAKQINNQEVDLTNLDPTLFHHLCNNGSYT